MVAKKFCFVFFLCIHYCDLIRGIQLSVSSTKPLCPRQLVEAVCSYPDILQESNGQRVYRYTIPGWTQNGERLFPDGVKFTTSTNSQTSESLMINTAMMSYSDMMSLNLRCYLVFNVNQTNKESNPQSISPPGENASKAHCQKLPQVYMNYSRIT
jgi:hypothetical protein